jgi:hypothetical protein
MRFLSVVSTPRSFAGVCRRTKMVTALKKIWVSGMVFDGLMGNNYEDSK